MSMNMSKTQNNIEFSNSTTPHQEISKSTTCLPQNYNKYNDSKKKKKREIKGGNLTSENLIQSGIPSGVVAKIMERVVKENKQQTRNSDDENVQQTNNQCPAP